MQEMSRSNKPKESLALVFTVYRADAEILLQEKGNCYTSKEKSRGKSKNKPQAPADDN